jgi:lipoprotein-releasing system ATP-binding protein
MSRVPVLALDQVWKGFHRGDRRLWVLQGVSLQVDAGELISVVGTRDQGKSTLVRVAAGIEPIDRGEVRIGEHSLEGLRDSKLAKLRRTEIGIATRYGPELRMQVRDYVGLHLVTGRRWKSRERRWRIGEALRLLEVEECAEARWRELSDWQRLRVELAQAIAPRPRLLLVDDLLDGLGLGKLGEANRLLQMLAQEIGCGVLMVASDHESALLSDRVWQLDHGKLTLMADHTAGRRVVPLRDDRQAS